MPDTLPYDQKDLLHLVSLGDETAFRQLFDHYWDHIYTVAFAFTKSAVLAEEMVQDVFVKGVAEKGPIARNTEIRRLPVYHCPQSYFQ